MPELDALFDSAVTSASRGLGLSVRKERGRVKVLLVSDLTAEDLEVMDRDGPEHSLPAVKEFRAKHHAIARYLVAGMSPTQISALTGDQPGFIDRLRKTPAFENLLASYYDEMGEVITDLASKVHLGADIVLTKLIQLVDEHGDSLEPEFLRKLNSDLLDRAGHGPVRTINARSLSTVLTAEDLARLKNEAEEQERGVVVEASFERSGASSGHSEGGEPGGGSGAPGHSALPETAVQRSSGEGDSV